VGVPQLEIFLSKFYLLNEKEKSKHYIKTPCEIYQSKLKIKGVLKISLETDYVSIRYSRRVLKGHPLYRGLKPEFFKKLSLVRLKPKGKNF
jgi:hypothetical protein